MYQPLLTSPTSSKEDVEVDDERSSSHVIPAKASPWTREVCIAVFLCAICTLVNGALSLLPSQQPSTQTQSLPLRLSDLANMRTSDIGNLRRPSQFINFDKIVRPSPPVQHDFDNYPILTAPVDSADVNKVFPVDSKQYMPNVGTISPRQLHVLVKDTISTVVQFRALDWGMEKCEVRLSLPALTSDALVRPGHVVTLSLYRLNITQQLDASTLTYATRPQRVTKVAEIDLKHGEEVIWHRNFACSMDQLLTFEVACSVNEDDGSGCSVEWWQGITEPKPAIYMIQHSTA
ncbi:hypothetical protein PENSPDRAFT_629405 [Peniophora sp. CONT]|nr:hypothetical protein PENSPDRAFT_629405 [Peniophora sp. CONT]